MKNKYVFAAVFHPEEVGGYSISFPQLDGCFTEGDTFDEAAEMAHEAMALHLFGMEQDNIPIPEANLDIKAMGDDKIVLVTAWMPPFRDEMNNKVVKKTVTIPAWMNQAGEAAGVNFSQLLQTAIRNYLNIS